MNNIYKVIWSKAKNCYVVASEIAKSHTKSASGSEKMGGYGKKALLALAAASAIFCGGLVNVGATVHVDEVTGGAKEVYTTTEVNTALADYGRKKDVENNKNNIEALRTTTTEQGQKITANATDIANIKTDIDKKIDKETAEVKLALKANAAEVYTRTDADGKFATKDALNNLTTTVNGKANEADVNAKLANKAETTAVTDLEGRVGGVEGKVTTLETKVGDATKGLVKDVADLQNQGNNLNAALGTKANKTDLDEANKKITANENKITDLQKKTAKLSDDGMKLTGMTAVGGATVSGTKVNAGALKVTGEISDGTVNTTLAKIDASMKQTETNKGGIADLQTKTDTQQTWIGRLKDRTTNITHDATGTSVDGVTFNAGAVTGVKSINGIDIGDTQVDMNGKKLTDVGTINGIDIGDTQVDMNGKNLTGVGTINGIDLGTVDTQVKTNADAIAQEKTDREKAIGSLTENKNYIKKDMNVSDNLVELDKQAKTNADNIKDNKDEIARVNGELVNTNNHFNTELRNTNAALQEEGKARAEADAKINTKIGNIDDTRTEYVKDANSISQNLTTLDEKLQNTNDRTGGIKRNTEDTQTTIEGSVKVDNQGNVKDVKNLSAETINTTGDAKVGGKLTAGDAELKNTTVDGTLTVTGEATFKDKVTMEKDLEVKGELKTDKISMKNTDTDPDGTRHNSSTTITADGITHIGEVEKNGVITKSQFTHMEEGSETYAKRGDATDWTETRSDLTADGVTTEVKDSKGNRTNTSQTANEIKGFVIDQDGNSSTASQTAKGINGNVTDKDGNKTDMNVTATENSIQIQDKDGKNTNLQVNKMDSSMTEITNADGKKTTTKQTATDITNTAEQGTIKNNAMNIENNASGDITNNAQNGTIKNDAKDIVNNATGDMTNTVGGKLNTTVTGQATENFNGGLDTTVKGTEKHTVNGNQINTVTEGQTNNITGGQTNNITGGQINKITGDQTTEVTNGDISNTANNITNEAKTELTDKVGTNTRVIDSNSITDTVGTKTNRKIEDGKITDTAGDFTVTTDKANGTTFAKTGSTATYSTEAGAPTDTNIAGNLIKTGRVEANELGVSDKDEHGNTADLSVKAEDGVKASASNGTTTGSLDVTADEVGSSVKDASGKGSTFKQRIDAIMGNVKTDAGESEVTQKGDEITSKVGLGEATNSRVTQKKGSLEAAVTDGTNTNDSYDVVNASAKVLSGGTKVNKLQDNLDSSEKTITNGTYTTSKVQTALDITNTAKDGTITNDAKDIVNNAKDTITNTAGTKITDTAGDSTVTTENGKGTTFTKTGSTASSFITADGTNTGTALEWTNVKGNEISTGKVEANYVKMDYADVMKDLGVHGNAKVAKSLEVGETTTTKTLKVTQNATVGGTLEVTGQATFHDDVDIANNLSVGKAVTAKSYKVGEKTYIDENGIHANGQKITDVADGSISEGSKDAVNGGQLYNVKNDLEGKVNKVGANAAAMANLHPMEFDPDSKWNIAAAIGNYGSETAAALGAFYRPNDDVMVNLSTAFGTGENMVGGGVSVRLGKGGNKLSREESNALKDQVNDLTARMDALLSVLNPNMSKDFPDVPENHWAYEAVSRLAGNDIVQGYPDGEFHGERTMTRYEMAEIIYNALSRGAEAEKELVEEFKPELQAMAASEKATAERAEG